MGSTATTELVRALERVHRAALQPRLALLGVHPGADLALAEIAAADGLTHAELAERLRVRPPSVTKVLRTLERDGLVFRLVDPDDARVSHVHLTREGRKLRPALRRAWQEADTEVLAPLSADERGRLRALLAKTLG
ncbi:MAG: MarR family transcriptional regulator [Solirubrobacterales bacterium]|nr:MarR family transcriptional regulator [Solirubrobacterales bacterium]